MARSRDGAIWDEPSMLDPKGADPAAVPAKDGNGWILAVTGPNVPGRQPGAGAPNPQGPNPQQPQTIRVERVDSAYAPAPATPSGDFRTGQPSDLVLGAFGFNQSGGASALNHPTGLATDGKRLIVADRWNNRVLIWNTAPSSNQPPDLVLGQKDFTTNEHRQGLDGMNWPGNVSLGQNGRLAVTDTNNHRVLLWNSFPSASGQPADLEISLSAFNSPGNPQRLEWPWGVWTDGEKLAVVATRGAAILIWNSWPSSATKAPDQILRPEGAGTPRNITSDGTFLMVSDHNFRGDRPMPPQGPGPVPPRSPADDRRIRREEHRQRERDRGTVPQPPPRPPGTPVPPPGAPTTPPGAPMPPAGPGRPVVGPGGPVTLIWNTWPTDATAKPDFILPEWMKGTGTANGGLILAGIQSISIWEKRPLDSKTQPSVRVAPPTYRNGDGPDAVIAGNRLYVSNYNGSNILAWHSVPTQGNVPPDFALGSQTPEEDVWSKRFFIQNPVVATDGKSLFVSSDFDRKLFVWKQLPGESGAKPDLVYHLPTGPWDNAMHDSTLVLGGRDTLFIWTKPPVDGQLPDRILRRRVGPVELREITGVAVDQRHLYVADRSANRVYVWKGIPGDEDRPDQILEVPNPGRMSSDGRWLTVAPFEGQEILAFPVSGLKEPPRRIGGRGLLNLPGKAIIADDRLVVADTGFNRVQVWNNLRRAFDGAPSDAILGSETPGDREPGLSRTKLFMPGSVAYDGSALWVGEFKFSTRILRFTPPGR